MRRRPPSCDGCSLAGRGTDFSRPEGTGANRCLIVGEASGEMEARDQLPFRPFAPAGAVLQRTLKRMGHDRNQFAISNVCRCRPPNNWLEKSPWEYAALSHCRPNLRDVIAEYKPRCIMALGGIALRELTGESGEARGISHLMGYPLPCQSDLGDGIPVIGNLHPAFIRRGKASHQGVFARVVQRAVNVAAGRDTAWLWNIDPIQEETYVRLNYNLHPSLDAAQAFYSRLRDNSSAVISYDIETSESSSLDEDARDGFADTNIRLIQFAGDGLCIALPWVGAYRFVARDILHLSNTKCGHNLWLFDNKVLEACGLREGLDLTPRGVIHDTLQMFHHWQPDLPAHLQFCAQFIQFPFPWKHLAATNLEFYGCVDVDSTLRLYNFLDTQLRRDGIYESAYDVHGDCVGGYIGQVAQVRPILAAMERRGLPVDDAERRKLDGEFDLAQQELDAALQLRVPMEVLNVEPRRGRAGNYSYGYLRTPKNTTELVERDFSEVGTGDDGNPTTINVKRWVRVLPFNPNSSDQLLKYMDAKKHKRPKSRETDDEGEEKDTTEKKELVRLAHRTGDDFYLRVIEYRELGKMRGTYINGFAPHADGCVHTTFTFDTGIGQLSCCAHWTPVRTYRGVIPIDEVEIGDMVWTHQRRWRPVVATWQHPDDLMVEVHFSTGQVLTCTPSHKLLVLDHVDKQRLDDDGERRESADSISQQGGTHRYLHLSEIGHLDPYDYMDTHASDVFSGIHSAKKTALLSVEDGNEESSVREDRRTASYLDRRGGRWVRVSDLFGGWCESVCASTGDGEGAGDQGQGASREHDSPSHRRRSKEQPYRQFSARDEGWPCHHTYLAACGLKGVAIEKVVAVGRFPVHDITVAEDESYESCGVFSHNSKNPNIQNFPKHGRLARATRRMIKAPDGYLFAEWDYKSCHVLTLGFLAEDETYIRFARIDMHSIMTGHFLKLWRAQDLVRESDDEIKARCRWLKSNEEYKHIRDSKIKHAGLGIGNGLKAKGLFERYMEFFTGQKEAARILADYEEVFPRVFAFQRRVQQEAHDQQYQKTQFGHIRRFYEVFRWDYKKAAYSHGDQAEEAISYKLSNIAFGYIREHMKMLERRGINERYNLVNCIHDSLIYVVPEELLAQHIEEVYPVLVTPSKVLRHPTIAPDGLWIDAECNIGRNWAPQDDGNPDGMREVSVKLAPLPCR